MASQIDPPCCDEHRCQRHQPIRVVRSELTGTWYAVTQYAERVGGAIESLQKHRIAEADQVTLERLFSTWERLEEGARPVRTVELPPLRECPNCHARFDTPEGPR